MNKKFLSIILSITMTLASCVTCNTTYAAKKKIDVKSITLKKVPYGTLTLKKKQNYTIKVTVSPNNATDKRVKFKSSNKKIATVSGKGVIKAVKNGKCNITVTSSKKNIKKVIKLTVGTPVTSVATNKKVLNLEKGEKFTLKCTVKPSKASNKKVSFKSSDKNIVSVSSKGVIKACKEGIAIVSGEANDGSGKKAECMVYVSDGASDNSVNFPVPDENVKEDTSKNEDGSENEIRIVTGENETLSESDAENIVIKFADGDCMGAVTKNIILPIKGISGGKISWTSSDNSVIDVLGNVRRPSMTKNVILTATVTNGKTSAKREFELTVIKDDKKIQNAVENTVDDIAELNGVSVSELDVETDADGYLSSVDGQYSNITVDSSETALESLNSVKKAAGIENVKENLVPSYAISDDEGNVYKFQQKYEGYDVYNGTVSVAVDKNGTADYFISDYSHMTGELNKNIMSKEDIKEGINKNYDVTVNDIEDKTVCYSDDNGKARLAYVAYVNLDNDSESTDSDNVVSEYEVLTDAVTGVIVSANPTQCSAFSNYIVEGKDLLNNDRKFHVLKTEEKKYLLFDMGKNIFVSRGTGNPNQQAVPGDVLWRSTITGWTKGAVSASANAKETYNYFSDKFGYKSYDDNNSCLYVQINTGMENNASWSNRHHMIYLGAGSKQSSKYKNTMLGADLDLVAHEYTHGVVQNLTELENIYFGTTGTINEAYADIFACFVESNWKKKNDWKIGESVTKWDCIRNIADPEKTGYPSKVGGKYFINYKSNDWKNSKKNDRCGVHRNSTIISHAAYLMNKKGISEENLEKLWFTSLKLGYSKYSDFYDVRKNVLIAAKRLKFSESKIIKIKEAFKEVGITKKTCDLDNRYFRALEKANTAIATGNSNADESYYYVSGNLFETVSDVYTDNNRMSKPAEVKLYEFDPSTNEVAEEPFAETEYSTEYGIFSIECNYCIPNYVMEISSKGYVTQRYYEADNTLGTCMDYPAICISKDGENGTAEGTIYDAESREKLKYAKLSFYAGEENRGYTDAVAETVSDEEGNYKISLAPGVYTGCAEVSGYYKEYFRVKIVAEENSKEQNCYSVQNKCDGSMVVSYVTRNSMDYAKSAVLSIQGIKNIKVKMEDYCMVSRVYPEDADYDGNFDIVCYQNHAGNFSHMLTIYTDNGIYKTITGPRDKERNWLVGSYNVNTLSAQVIGGTL